MICPKCGNDCGDSKFCGKCGSPLYRKCHFCGEEITFDNQFCPHCGKDNSESSIKKNKLKKKRTVKKITIFVVVLLILAAFVALGVKIVSDTKKHNEEIAAEEMKSREALVRTHFFAKGDIDLGTFLFKQTSDDSGTIVHITLKPTGSIMVIDNGHLEEIDYGYFPIVETNTIIGNASFVIADSASEQHRVFANKVISYLFNMSRMTRVDPEKNASYKYRCQGDAIEVRYVVSGIDQPLESSYMYISINGGGQIFNW